jgi:hypothetical protein
MSPEERIKKAEERRKQGETQDSLQGSSVSSSPIDVYSKRDKGSINSDFEVWKSQITEVVDTAQFGSGSMRPGIKSYMNNYAFISFGSDDIGFGSQKNEFVSGSDISGLMASPDEWKVPTTKNIIEWSKKLKSSSPYSVRGAEESDIATSGGGAEKFGKSSDTIATENNSKFSSGGSIQGIGMFDYDWKDFVFCKNYGKIPNNRLLTLRRYKLPVLDNGVVGGKGIDGDEKLKKGLSEQWGAKASGQDELEWIKTDSARALTYFGEGTDNTLSGLFPFTVGLNWETRTTTGENRGYNNNVSGDGTNFLTDPNDYLQVINTIGSKINSFIPPGVSNLGGNFKDVLTVGAIYDNMDKLEEKQGKSRTEIIRDNFLDNDPYKNGWMYRILGPVNVLLKTHSRKRGLKFDGGVITLSFEYNMAQIGTMNPKLAMIDIISNMLSLTTNSGSFWGGDYRFKRDLTDIPMPDSLLEILEQSASGSHVDYSSLINTVISDIQGKASQFINYVGGNTKDLVDVLETYYGKNQTGKNPNDIKQEILELKQRMSTYAKNNPNFKDSNLDEDLKNKEQELLNLNNSSGADGLSKDFFTKLQSVIKDGSQNPMVKDGIRILLNQGIMNRNGDVKTMAKNLMLIKPLITGEPVGEWHLTVGNPMQPVAMIGNLICTGMSMTLSEELGYDDFPTSIKFKVTLDHGRDRDKGDIESMFNMGQGRTYLNIKGATPWETGYSTRSSDNDNVKGPGEDQTNPDGTYSDSKSAQKNAPNKLEQDKKNDGSNKDKKDSLDNNGGGTTIPNWNNEGSYPDGSENVNTDYYIG